MAQKYRTSNGLWAAGLGLLGGALLWWGLRRRPLRELMPFNQSSTMDSSSRNRRAALDREVRLEVSSSITETAWEDADLSPRRGTGQHWSEYSPSSSGETPGAIPENSLSDQEPARGEALADLAGSASSSEGWPVQSRLAEEAEEQAPARGEALADIAGSASLNETWQTRSRSPEQAEKRESAPLTEETARPLTGQAKPAILDDLTPIEGIGPKINKVLHDAGITSFAQLAETEVSQLEQILSDAGLRLANADTWPEQAGLAAAGDWDGLKRLQDQLDGGRRRG